ncbi:MAG: efflux transporter outer membrane subunit [Opitutaceae bacterium]|jgi:multidrug efflux system outer membrane protein|nr:efflux transporter outer membrane subunit [Opitutaceae bacterium]
MNSQPANHRHHPRHLAALAALAAAALAGCTMAPKYEQPDAQVPANFAHPAPASADATTTPADATTAAPAAADIGWRDFFGDERLRRLITLALENNRDLRVAALRAEQVRAQYQIERSGLIPSIGASGAGTRQRTPGDLNATGRAATSSQYNIGLGVTAYELDFFGRVRSLKTAALETYLATDEGRRAAQLALIAALAAQYILERSADEQHTLAAETLKLVRASNELVKRRHDAGQASELDLRTAETQVYAAQAALAEHARQRALAANALALLVGAPLPTDLPAPAPLGAQGLRADLPSGLPSDLLTRRPDILQAEHALRSANASIGAARANFFPSITLTAFGGTASAELDGLFKTGSGTWNFAPKITLPLFTAGRNRAVLKSAQAAQQITVAQYEKAVQTAFREVADALASRQFLAAQIAAQESRVAAEQRRHELSDLRYREGVDNYLVVLTAQQNLYSAQQGLIQARSAGLSNLVGLYKALGGGWQETTTGQTIANK